MDVKERILIGKLIEKMNRLQEFSEVLGLKDVSRFSEEEYGNEEG